MKTSRLRWLLFGACAVLVVGAMTSVTGRMLDLEAEQATASAQMRHQERVRLALWRMDTAIAPLLASEAADLGNEVTLARMKSDSSRDVGWWPDERVRVRFRTPNDGVGGGRGMTLASADPIAQVEPVTRTPLDAADQALVAALRQNDNAKLAACVVLAEPAVNAYANSGEQEPTQTFDGSRDRGMRKKNANTQQAQAEANGRDGAVPPPDRDQEVAHDALASLPYLGASSRPTPTAVAALAPVWLASGPRRWLVFARTVARERRGIGGPLGRFGVDGSDPRIEGFALDWTRTEASLIREVSDVLPGARLIPVATERYATDQTGLVLATLPAALEAPVAAADPLPLTTPTRTGLAVAWLAVIAALTAAALTLRATVADGERRARFASSVTHELRTPLTTFRLYSEMLADGMVSDEATRAEYLATLKTESSRLAGLVENVLAYARVEEGRAPRATERVSVAELLDRSLPALRRRCDEAGAILVLRNDAPDLQLNVNSESVQQILANLVDNACKYGVVAGASAADRTIDIIVARQGDGLRLTVRDRGPGIAAENVRAAFTPFERANRPPGDGTPGIGLGLALSRGLAKDAGGDVVHEVPEDGRGAQFVATLGVSHAA